MSKRNRNKNPWLTSRPAAAAATPAATTALPTPNPDRGTIVLPHEDAVQFERLLAGFDRSFRPQGEDEILLVRHLAESQWLILRAARLEAALMTLIAAGEDAKPSTPDQRIAAYMLSKPGDALVKVQRYATSAQRAYYRALKVLHEIAATRAELQDVSEVCEREQFVSQNAESAAQFVSQKPELAPSMAPEAPCFREPAAA